MKTPTLIIASKDMPESAQQLAEAMPNAILQLIVAPTYQRTPKDIAKYVARHSKVS